MGFFVMGGPLRHNGIFRANDAAMNDYWLFLGAAVLLTLSPGPDNLQVLTRGITQGRRVAVVAAAGFASGVLVHTGLAVAGVALLIRSSPLLFGALKLFGAAYLLWLGYKTLQQRDLVLPTAVAGSADLRRVYRQSFLANVLNPKVTLFFLSFLPQFVDPAKGAVAGQMLVLGLIFMLQAFVIFAAIGLSAAHLGGGLRAHPRWGRRLNTAAGCVFLAVGLKLAIA